MSGAGSVIRQLGRQAVAYGPNPIVSKLTGCRVSVTRMLRTTPDQVSVSVFSQGEDTTTSFVKLSRAQAEELRDRLSAALDDIEQGN